MIAQENDSQVKGRKSLILKTVKRVVRESALGPLALRLRKAWFPARSEPLSTQNAIYDKETFAVMSRVLQPNSCCIDVGAHSGIILREMVRLSPLGTHFAFEPLPDFAAVLRDAFPNVRIFEAAVSDYAGTSSFVHVENDPGYSGLRKRIYDEADPVLKAITVNVVQIDDVIPQEQPIAFLKVDIEGGEYHALRGAYRTIRRWNPVIVFEAGQKSTGQYGVTPEEIYRLITEELGFRLSTMRRWLSGEPPYDQSGFCDKWRNGQDYYFIACAT